MAWSIRLLTKAWLSPGTVLPGQAREDYYDCTDVRFALHIIYGPMSHSQHISALCILL